jgi:phosphoribosylanthranilate isomerase
MVATEAGADMLGLVFAPSRRQIKPIEAAAISTALAASGQKPTLVGLFVNEQPDQILAIAEQCKLDLLQLSGDEELSVIEQLPGRRILKSVRLLGGATEDAWLRPGPHHARIRLLVDAHVAGNYGGTGAVANWDLAAQLAARLPIMLAGGLKPDTVAQAIWHVRPWAVDVSSGVETDGVKDPHKIRAFIKAARAAAMN